LLSVWINRYELTEEEWLAIELPLPEDVQFGMEMFLIAQGMCLTDQGCFINACFFFVCVNC